MDHTNHWYGHAHALAAYCGLDPATPPPINGVLQHGWTFVHGYGANHRIDPSMSKLVWSDVSRRRGHLVGWRNYHVIGAPFLYLDRIVPTEEHEREGTIWYPFHGTKDYEKVTGNHKALIDEIRDTEEGPVTMCLYYVEYEDHDIRFMYERAGFRVITHGHRGRLYQGTDRFFMLRQLTELRKHRRVASNRLTTAVFYGIAAGCAPAVYGDPMEFQGARAGYDGTLLLDRLWPEMFGPHIDVERAREITRDELGADWLMEPEELKIALGWS